MQNFKNLCKTVARAGLALAMTCGMSATTVFANNLTADNNTGKITVSGVEEGTTVNIYRIIDLELDSTGTPVTPEKLVWNEGVQSFVTAINSDYIDATTKEVTETFKTLESASDTSYTDAKAFYDALAAKLTTATDTATAAGTSVEFTGLAMGQYLITVDGGDKVYNNTVVSVMPEYDDTDGWVLDDVAVDMKSSEQPDVAKTADNKTVAIGDTITYTIKASVPQFDETDTDKKFVISDTQGEGLTLKLNTIVIIDADKNPIAADGNYTIAENTENNGFDITFTDDFLSNTGSYAGTTITITYASTVNANGVKADALKNSVSIDYGKDSTSDTEVTSYTYSMDLTKVAKGNHDTTLADAEFEMKNSDNKTMYFTEANGVYTYAGTTAGTGLTSTIKTTSAGTLKVQGINVGTYTLTETKAPADYALPSGSITVTLADAESDGTLDNGTTTATCTGTAGLVANSTSVSGGNVSITVENSDNSFWTMPKTGDVGTIVYAFGGLVIMATAAAVLIHIRRRNEA